MKSVYKQIQSAKGKGKCLFTVLIDPDKLNLELVKVASKVADCFFVGGSKLKNGELKHAITQIKKYTKKPVIIFPGDTNQIDKRANAILLLSLVSGRNPDYLIGKHVQVARKLRLSNQEIIPTAYILINGGKQSTTEKVTKTTSISNSDKNKIIDTAIASQLLGMRLVYLEAGSGAKRALSKKIIESVKKHIDLPLIVGGGIDSAEKFMAAKRAGADMIVVGNALEKNIYLLNDIKKCLA